MNYWPAEIAISARCRAAFRPGGYARPDGRHVAKTLYGAGGFVMHHNTDIWGDAVPIDGVKSGLWPMGGAWLSLHFWEHYQFTMDRKFLAERAYPVMKEASEFLLDYLVDDGHGQLLSGPSLSPENRYKMSDGTVASISMGPYMDTEIAWRAIRRGWCGGKILGVDADFRAERRNRARPFTAVENRQARPIAGMARGL